MTKVFGKIIAVDFLKVRMVLNTCKRDLLTLDKGDRKIVVSADIQTVEFGFYRWPENRY